MNTASLEEFKNTLDSEKFKKGRWTQIGVSHEIQDKLYRWGVIPYKTKNAIIRTDKINYKKLKHAVEEGQ